MDNKLYEMMDWAAVEGIVYSEEDHPHDILGAHVTEEGILIQTFLPTAKSVTVVLKDSKKEYPMDLEDEEGFFAALLPGKKIPKYHYHVDFGEEADGKARNRMKHDIKGDSPDSISQYHSINIDIP